MIRQKLSTLVFYMFCCAITYVYAQAGTSASGGEGSGDGGKVSYTVGLVSYMTFIGSGGNIMQGVQHPYDVPDPCEGITAAIAAGGPTAICNTDSVVLTVSSIVVGDTYVWRKNGMAIPGATSSSYTGKKTGAYACDVTTAEGCAATSNSISISVNPKVRAIIKTPNGTDLCGLPGVRVKANTGVGLTYQWYLDGSEIAGATVFNYKATIAGDYTVLVTNSYGCSLMSEITSVINSCRIQNDAGGAAELSLYPNPALNEFTVVLNTSKTIDQDVMINIYSVVGNLIYAQSAHMINGSISEKVVLVNAIPSGLYIVKVLAGNNEYTQQLLIQE
ncbi:MAG: T9SS type A sorting domain-containing protein [Fimbriimonadaceae bacterium]|nr:T9SS type A sorting domain-containing protein [Chitinophagales bacterium]